MGELQNTEKPSAKTSKVRKLLSLFLDAPDGQLDYSMVKRIEKLLEQDVIFPSEIKVILDYCAYGGLASEFVMRLLHTTYEVSLNGEEL